MPHSMKAWRLERPGGALALKEVPLPQVRPGSVLVRIEASVLMSYLDDYVAGRLPAYQPPPGEFTIGTNGVGIVEAVGRDVAHIEPRWRVLVSSHFVARDQVEDPGQMLIGLTAGAGASRLQDDWPDGTLAEYVLVPVEAVTPAQALEHVDPVRLAALTRFIIPYGGLLRGRLAPGETMVVTGATGAYGTAAVMLGLAMGAARVVAAGRNRAALAALERACGPRLVTVALDGDAERDAAALRTAAGGGAHLAFDMVGNAADPNATLAALGCLRRTGRLVLMGSMRTNLPLPYTTVMLNSWEILGQFMYPASAYPRLLALAASGLLDTGALQPRSFALAALPEAMQAASRADSLEYVVVQP